ncbi:MAG: IS1595 family transposase [Holophagales bacterium]|nr:IS1595 family transposase [Holophagales bacterium]
MTEITQKAPGKHYREGISLFKLHRLFPNEEAARKWFESALWGNERHCPRCGGNRTREASHRFMPYWCTDCRKYFSVKVGTVMEASQLPLLTWLYAIYLEAANLKGVSSMELHRALDISQKSAWFVLHRIRAAFKDGSFSKLEGIVEVDEMFVGGKQKNRHKKDRDRFRDGDGGGSSSFFGKKPVIGAISRDGKAVAAPIDSTDGKTLTRFVEASVKHGSRVYTDDHGGYGDLMETYMHRTVRHSLGEYVRSVDVHTNTIESLWSMFKRGFVGKYHRMSFKHLHRYVDEFVWRRNVRDLDTMEQMVEMVRGMANRRLRYADLVA